MEDIINKMALVPVSPKMIEKVDMASLLKSLEGDFEQLENFKKFRNDYEEKNFIGRWWDNNELEGAQLDAVVLQASFSKKLGQLMVVAIKQSQMLTQQQVVLKEQQEEIKSQTQDIASVNRSIADQQGKLAEQQRDMQKLIDDYFELKGLTAEGAKKLILIAKEVETTKDQLIDKVEQSVAGIHQLRDKLINQLEEQISKQQQLEKNIQSRQESQTHQLGVMSEQLKQQSIEGHRNLQTVKEAHSAETVQLHRIITEHKQISEKHNADLREEISGFSNQLIEQQASAQSIVNQQQQQINTLKWIAASGLVLAIGSISAFIWQHRIIFEF